MDGFRGWIATRPMCCVAASPMCVHDSPPSSERYTPSPQVELCRLFASPVPTQTMPGSLGAIAMSPMDVDRPSRSKTGDHVVPLFVERKTPPPAVPTKIVPGFPGTASMSSMRPPNEAGPIERHGSPDRSWAPSEAARLRRAAVRHADVNGRMARVDSESSCDAEVQRRNRGIFTTEDTEDTESCTRCT